MVIETIRTMSVKGVKLKSESFFSISPGVLELWRKNRRGGFRPLPDPDGVKGLGFSFQVTLNNENFDLAKFSLYS